MKIKTNPAWTDAEVQEFRETVKANEGYCPCRLEQSGLCHCGLYYKES